MENMYRTSTLSRIKERKNLEAIWPINISTKQNGYEAITLIHIITEQLNHYESRGNSRFIALPAAMGLYEQLRDAKSVGPISRGPAALPL
jgi:hypothetical protein